MRFAGRLVPVSTLVFYAGICAQALLTPLPALDAQGLQRSLPSALSDAQFWRLITDLSEPGGQFQSDNLSSNEMGFPSIVSALRADHDTGGAYVGVGPEQNFTYIAAIHPQIAFIVDIRRQAVMQHLMYKAIFELAKDRADFVSLLFSKRRPAGLDSNSTIAQVWDAYFGVATDTSAYATNLARIKAQLTRTHGLPLDSTDLASLTYVYRAFYWVGPIINYGTVAGPFRVTAGGTCFTFLPAELQATSCGPDLTRLAPRFDPHAFADEMAFTVGAGPVVGPVGPTAAYYGGVNFASVTAATDALGAANSFLGTEENYRFVKGMEARNLVVPVVGDFAGPKALRSIGQYLRDNHAMISAFYTSNVEEYLFDDRVEKKFYANLAVLPIAAGSVLIRNGTDICPIPPFLATVAAGRIAQYDDIFACRR